MKRLYVLLSLPLSLAAVACGGGSEGGGPDAAPAGAACSIESTSEATPGAPYAYNVYQSSIVPILKSDCTGAACHTNGIAGFFVYDKVDVVGDCDQVNTFNSFIDYVDLATPSNSRIILAINGSRASHAAARSYPAGDAKLTAITDFIAAASAANAASGGGGTNVGGSPADPAVFETQIQPILDTGVAPACTSCHGAAAGAGGLILKPNATGADLTANFTAAVGRLNLDTPEQSLFYLKATNSHTGSVALPAAAAQTLLAWIQAAAAANDNGGAGLGCTPAGNFNLGVYTNEILPMFRGLIDYNDLQNGNVRTGCVSNGQCHETDRGPGKFTVANSKTPEELLENFSCFVDAQNPSRSAAVMCPLGPGGRGFCPIPNGHPGDVVFDDAADLNFQRLLSFVYTGKGIVQPFDFAFFVENINPIFSDINSCSQGATAAQLECNNRACHGVTGFNLPPPNGSDFPMLQGAVREADVTVNFTNATAFSSFLKPEDASLRLYPTDLIQDGSDFSTGIPHGGGECFPPGSALDLLFLQFVGGLRPVVIGVESSIENVLAAGDFSATAVTDTPPITDRLAVDPLYQYRLFEQPPPGNAFFQGGDPQLVTADANVNDGFIDLNAAFPRDPATNRIAYAQVCFFNSSAFEVDINIDVDTALSQNDAEIFINGLRQGAASNGLGTAIANNVGSYLNGGEPVRVQIKVFQSVGDPAFGFTLKVSDEQRQPFPDGELIYSTSCPDGTGI